MYSIIGVVMQVISGVAVASFMVPLSRINRWRWAHGWLLYAAIGWLVLPWCAYVLIFPDPAGLFVTLPGTLAFWLFVTGMLWGIGWMCWGAAVHLLGISLGTALCVGMYVMCATVIPPVLMGESRSLTYLTSGNILQLGVIAGGIGMVICFRAGRRRETDKGVKDRLVRMNKGAVFAILAGFFCCFQPLGYYIGFPIAEMSRAVGVSPMWRNAGTLTLMLTGGFLSMTIVSVILLTQHRKEIPESTPMEPYSNGRNLLLAASAGILWFGHVLVFDLGKLLLHFFDYAALPIFLTGVYITAAVWGGLLAEWRDSQRMTRIQMTAGFFVLLMAAGLMIFGAYLSSFGL